MLRALRAELPHERFVYFADSAYNPYGDKSEAFVQERSLAIVKTLVQQHRIKVETEHQRIKFKRELLAVNISTKVSGFDCGFGNTSQRRNPFLLLPEEQIPRISRTVTELSAG